MKLFYFVSRVSVLHCGGSPLVWRGCPSLTCVALDASSQFQVPGQEDMSTSLKIFKMLVRSETNSGIFYTLDQLAAVVGGWVSPRAIVRQARLGWGFGCAIYIILVAPLSRIDKECYLQWTV